MERVINNKVIDAFISKDKATNYSGSLRSNGSHSIYVNKEGHHMSIPRKIACVIARRLIKENNLCINKKVTN